MFENRALTKVFGRKREKVKEEWRNSHTEELVELYSLPNIIRVFKSKRLRGRDMWIA
jgi:hypothetical protein